MTLSTNTVAITNLDVDDWTRKSELPQGNLLHSLTQPKIIKKQFELKDTEYGLIKDKIARM